MSTAIPTLDYHEAPAALQHARLHSTEELRMTVEYKPCKCGSTGCYRCAARTALLERERNGPATSALIRADNLYAQRDAEAQHDYEAWGADDHG